MDSTIKSLSKLTLIFAALFLFNGCNSFRFQYYDETTDKQVTQFHYDLNSFLSSSKDKPKEETDIGFSNFLDQISILEIRARSRRDNQNQIEQLKLLKQNVLLFKDMFPVRNDEEIELVRNSLEISIGSILQGELAKPRK